MLNVSSTLGVLPARVAPFFVVDNLGIEEDFLRRELPLSR